MFGLGYQELLIILVIVLILFGANRLPNVSNLDLRLAKDFTLMGTVGLNLSIDAFNVLNRHTVLDRDVALTNGVDASTDPTYNHISTLLSPRVLRFGARVKF